MDEGVSALNPALGLLHVARIVVSSRSGDEVNNWLGSWNDSCIDEVERCRRTQGISNAHNIDAIGFLLSCKQTYTEGIDFLYSANCINIRTESLLLHLPKLIRHNRLASITSLEVIIEAHRVEKEQENTMVSFIFWQHHGHDLLDGPALPLVDAFWRSTKLRDMRVELPSRDYWVLNTSGAVIDYQQEAPTRYPSTRLDWKSLDGEEPKVERRSPECYPYPPLRMPVRNEENDSKESSGYWL
ncbi:uncharacterized protein M421DRAFT_88583 [Didymella exigua CBS 183.55]|uniref:DUF7730 domain-containing protein n=1 Tax=Didymella exigua CBS 183.55 TaxID=1150837 RepID=A0A6A5S175_9PLEO|nr:uncharacterized protein M421DRAFT_88583 [Didymella exigua CBS 183.55]KAF1933350.1 hypothetical protein M421DRAFT_88583 [Didymella exigua CBS 183.55]